MQAVGQRSQRAPDGAPIHYERHRPEQTTLHRLVQQHATSFIAHTEASTGSGLPRHIKDEFDAFLECGILAHGLPRLRCGECGHDKLLAFSCKRRGFCPSCGARWMSQTAVHLVDRVIPHAPLRQWVLSLPIPLRLLLAAQPDLATPALQVVQRVIARHLLGQAGLATAGGHGGAVTLIQRFGSAANLNFHLHCLVLDGLYRRLAFGRHKALPGLVSGLTLHAAVVGLDAHRGVQAEAVNVGAPRLTRPGLPRWRVLFLLAVTCAGAGVLLYLLLWMFVPEGEGSVTVMRA